jgi:large subunit ribosomal protein L18
VSMLKKLKQRHTRRVLRVRSRQFSRGQKPRVSVFRSLNHIYAQIIDDNQQKTMLSFSSRNLKKASGSKKDLAKKVGLELGKLAVVQKISDIFFDRGSYRYHGRVQALADGLREAGLKF